jgi:poly-beta-1,6-N-acetyl-D-glucosamine N-deacetylase
MPLPKTLSILIALCLMLATMWTLTGCKKDPELTEKGKKSSTKSDDGEVVPAEETGPEPTEKNICFRAQNRRVPVLMFHDLVPVRDKTTLWYDCTIEEFEQILTAIDLEGFTVISCDDLYQHLTIGKDVPEKSIVITFDDNYQSFYDYAWPILQRYEYPVAMFVHTGFVGKLEGRPKMSWDTLKELAKSELFTVGAHTINHYLDLKERDTITQQDELVTSKADLERELGIDIPYMAYPNGSNSEETQLLAQQAGYKMAFTIENTAAEESPNIYAVGRYVHTRLMQSILDKDNAILGAPADIFRTKWKEDAPVRYVKGDYDGVPLRMTFGGKPQTAMSQEGREPVKNFVDRLGGVAGINGGFFAMAAIASTDNRMVGPLKTPDMTEIEVDESKERWPKINNRPLVIWSKDEFALLPYIPAQMRVEEQYQYFMKDYTDCFMGGVWLVHNGVPRISELQNAFGASDIQDYRRRAFIGVTAEGEFVAGAAVTSVSSERLARAIAEAGVEEAVLIDSGFSTSLIYDGKVKASGHSSPKDPSRPVPHAIVIMGDLDPSSVDDEDIKSVSQDGGTPRRKRRRR